VTVRDLATAAFVLAALLYGQLDSGDRAQEPEGALCCALGKGAGPGHRASDG
jgi:hypothetical protein